MYLGRIMEKLVERVYFYVDQTDNNNNISTSSTSASKMKKGKGKSAKAAPSPMIISSQTVPYYYYGLDSMQEILNDIDLLTSNINMYNTKMKLLPDVSLFKLL